jgi:hypothetical protein
MQLKPYVSAFGGSDHGVLLVGVSGVAPYRPVEPDGLRFSGNTIRGSNPLILRFEQGVCERDRMRLTDNPAGELHWNERLADVEADSTGIAITAPGACRPTGRPSAGRDRMRVARTRRILGRGPFDLSGRHSCNGYGFPQRAEASRSPASRLSGGCVGVLLGSHDSCVA